MMMIALGLCLGASAFGRFGHAGIAAIARAHLTPTAKETIDYYLGGDSVIEVASWMDRVRRTPEYCHTTGWHSAAIDGKGKANMWHKSKARGQYGITSELAKIQDGGYKEMTDSAVAVSIKLLIHMIGDIHCPSHSSFKGKSQGFAFEINGQRYQFHKFFDGGIFTLTREWEPMKFQEELDTLPPEQIAPILEGTLTDWIEENGDIMRCLYSILTPDRVFDAAESRAIIESMTALTDLQMIKAGYRLAHVLNKVFDPEYK